MRFNQEGTILYSGGVDALIRRYSVSTPWDITSTLTLLDEFDLDTISAGGLYIKPNSDKMFTVNATEAEIFAYDLGIKTEGAFIPLTLGHRSSTGTTAETDIETFEDTDVIVGMAFEVTGTEASFDREITIPSDLIAKNGRIFIIKDEVGDAAGTNKEINILTEGSQTIDGETDYIITTNDGGVQLYSDGTNLFSMGTT